MPISKNIVICGGAGFIGSHLVDEFLRREAHVTVIDPCQEGTSGSARNLPAPSSSFAWISCEVESLPLEPWDEVLSTCTCLIDAMGFTRHREGMEHPNLDARLNYLNHLAVTTALRRRPVPVIYLGSRGQYGALRGRVGEEAPMVPLDAQGVHKLAAESMYRIESAAYGYSCYSLRLGNCYGPRQPTTGRDIGLVGGFIRQLLEGSTVEIYGDPETRARQLVFVEDVAKCVADLSERPPQGFKALNLGGPKILLKDLLTLMTSRLGGKSTFRPFPDEIKAMDCGDGELAQERLFHHCPGLTFSDLGSSLEKTCAYFKNEHL